MTEPDISVIVPVYNCADTLRRCLDSLLAQTGPAQLEVLIVDDGSPGGEESIIDDYVSFRPDLFRSFRKLNGGLSDARNFGVRHARGRFIGFVDSDDYVEPEMYSALLESAQRLNAEVAISKYFHEREDGRTTVQCNLGWLSDEVRPGTDFLMSERSMVVWNKIYRREIVEHFPQPVRWFEDVAWTPTIMSFVDRVSFVDSAHYHYVRRAGSIASSHDDPRTLDGIGSVYHALEQCNPQRYDFVHYMAIRRMLFECIQRPGYSDLYTVHAVSLYRAHPANPLIIDDDALFQQLGRYAHPGWAPIPKRVVHYFDQSSVQGAPANLEKLGYSDTEWVRLPEPTDLSVSDGVRRLCVDEPAEARAYFALRYIAEHGGVYVAPSCAAHGPIAPLLLDAGFVASTPRGTSAHHAFGAIPQHPGMTEWLRLADEYVLDDGAQPVRRALERVMESQRRTSAGTRWTPDVIVLHPPDVLTQHVNQSSVLVQRPLPATDRNGPPTDPEFDTLMGRVTRLQDENKRLRTQLQRTKRRLSVQQASIRWRLARRLEFLERSRLLRLIRELADTRRENSSAESKNRRCYARQITDRPLDEGLVLLESFYGRGVTSSPLAIFLAWMDHASFDEYQFVWAVDSKSGDALWPDAVPRPANVKVVERGSELYYRTLATARVLVNDVTFYHDFVKRPRQVYLNTWHSVTIKSLGFDVPGRRLDQKNVVKNFLLTDRLIAANSFVANDTFLRAHRLAGLYEGEIHTIGHPRSDLTYRTSRETILSELRGAGIDIKLDQKTILYAPTWRGTNVNQPSDDVDLYQTLCEALAAAYPATNVLFRPHQITHAHSNVKSRLGLNVIPPSIDANRLFAGVDVLVTDYSSIFVDYLITGRPVAFFVPDIEEYRRERGLHYRPQDLPGPVASTVECLVTACRDLLADDYVVEPRYQEMAAWACPFDDGSAGKRSLEIALGAVDDTRDSPMRHCGLQVEQTPRLAIFAGALRGGRINSRVENLSRTAQDLGYDVSVLCDDSAHPKFQFTVGRLLDDGVRVLGRSAHVVYTTRELNAAAFERIYGPNLVTRRLLGGAWGREWIRGFGAPRFDALIVLDPTNYELTRVLNSQDFGSRALWLDEALDVALRELPWRGEYSNFRVVRNLNEALVHLKTNSREL